MSDAFSMFVRLLVGLAALAGLYLGIVLLYAAIQENAASGVSPETAIFSANSTEQLAEAAGHLQSASVAWGLAGFSGREAEAKARAALLLEPSGAPSREQLVALVEATLALRPTLAMFWFQLARLQLRDPIDLPDFFTALTMAHVTAPRELSQGIARPVLLLQNWRRIIAAGSTADADRLRDILVQDITANVRNYTPSLQALLRANFDLIPEADRTTLRAALAPRIGAILSEGLITPVR